MSTQHSPYAPTRPPNAPQTPLPQLFTDHIHHLERHTQLLLQIAAQHSRSVPSNTTIADICEVKAMSDRAEQALKDARSCQRMFEGSSLPQVDGAYEHAVPQTVTGTGTPRRKRASEDVMDLPGGGSAKRLRVCLPGVMQPLEQYAPRPVSHESSETTSESREQECNTTPEMEHEDIREEVMARLKAAARRRQESDGSVQKKAVKRKRDVEDEEDEVLDSFVNRLQEAQTQQRVRKRLRGFIEGNRRARGES